VNCDSDDLGQRVAGRTTLEEIFIKIFDRPVWGSGAGKAGESERRGEDVLAEAGARILGIERIDEKGVAQADGQGRGGVIEERGVSHIARQIERADGGLEREQRIDVHDEADALWHKATEMHARCKKYFVTQS
jgi:hypothetical protein